jgi:hypothetical protein
MYSAIGNYTLLSVLVPVMALGACEVRSGAQTAALVELYTSEGCSSCPPADRFLNELPGARYRVQQLVPIALHVSYWDYIGWKDPYAKPVFVERQRWLTAANHQRVVYTPHVFVAGTEVQSWRSNLDDVVRRVNAMPAQATIKLRADGSRPGTLAIEASATVVQDARPAELYVAITENRLTSNVHAGENRGVTLTHDHVVREWLGPIALVKGQASIARQLPLPQSWQLAQLGVVAFVQSAVSRDVLQAVAGDRCLAP